MEHTKTFFLRSLLLAALLFDVIAMNAQNLTISFSSGIMTVEDSFRQIEAQSDYRIIYSRKNIDTDRMVRFTSSEMPIERALEQALSGTGNWYSVQGKYIILQKREQPITEEKSIRLPSLPTLGHGESYVRTNMNEQSNINRRRPLQAPVIQIMDTTKVVADDLCSMNTDQYTSYIVPIDSYINNRLPRFALKTNLLHGIGTLTPNVGVEFGLGRRTSLEIYGGINPWKLQSKIEDNKKLAHIFVRPEFRYWLCERFNGHFFGIHGIFAHYNVGSHDIPLLFEKEYRYDGIAWGSGVSYGYFLPFSKRWGIEFNIGFGLMYMKYDRFDCAGCEKSAEAKTKTYFGPTRAGITLVFNIK